MVRIFIRVCSLCVMLILGIFLGIDSAEKNMQKVQGTEGAPRTIQIVPHNGKIEISVMGKSIQTINPVEDTDKKPEANAEDAAKAKTPARKEEDAQKSITTWGNKIGSGIKQATKGVMDFVTNWVK